MATASKYHPYYPKAYSGIVVHQAKLVYQDRLTKLWMQQVLDGQYEPHGGRRPHRTKAEKKADRKASIQTMILKRIREGKTILRSKGDIRDQDENQWRADYDACMTLAKSFSRVLIPEDEDIKGWN